MHDDRFAMIKRSFHTCANDLNGSDDVAAYDEVCQDGPKHRTGEYVGGALFVGNVRGVKELASLPNMLFLSSASPRHGYINTRGVGVGEIGPKKGHSMSNLGAEGNPARVAIVGGGPSGFYTAAALLDAGTAVTVDLFERLCAPFGLVRYGVAPDHQKLKQVAVLFDKVARRKGFTYWGNVEVGRDLQIDELQSHFDAVVIATGAETHRDLGVPGERLKGSHAAIEFVGWYNGHPDWATSDFDLSCETAVIIGNGNVALDIARMLAKPASELATSDIASEAERVLASSKVKRIHVIGRRGPAQHSFSLPELRELGEIDGWTVRLDHTYEELQKPILVHLEGAELHQKEKTLELLLSWEGRSTSSGEKEIVFSFLQSPLSIEGESLVQRIVLGENQLDGEPGAERSVATGEESIIECGLVISSIGYKGLSVEGVPFDDKAGTVPNEHGRIQTGLYTAGWIARGAYGLIGTNKADALDVVKAFEEDMSSMNTSEHRDTRALGELLATRGVRVLNYDDWCIANESEIRRGQQRGKVREKFVTPEEVFSSLTDRAADA